MDILANSAGAVRASDGVSSPSPRSWSAILAAAYRRPRELADALGLSPAWVCESLADIPEFPLFAPEPFVARIQHGNPHDPLLRQVWPSKEERARPAGFARDPLREADMRRDEGVLQKYAGRALLVTTGACGVHCRYCFRRHWDYSQSPTTIDQWRPALGEIAGDHSITEVILSGGDPLTWPDAKLQSLMEMIATMPYVRRLRIHSRMPIVIPQRLTAGLLDAVESAGRSVVLVVHANHAQELDGLVAQRLELARRQGWLLLNQAVLLRGVNDDFDAQRQLSERLLECGVLPYYLHQMDRVEGAAHFEVPLERGRQLVDQLRSALPGYLVPRYVVEQPGKPSKTWLV
jgi:EF-P beta-lysylation protein EpmB